MTFPEKTTLRPSMYFVLMITGLLGFDMLVSPLISAKALGNAGYFAPLAAAVPAVAAMCAIFALQKRFPGQSWVQYSIKTIGRIPATIILLLLMITWRFYTTLLSRDIMSLVSTHMLIKTPTWVFSLMGFLGIIYLAYHGIESISRFMSFVFVPASIVVFLVALSAMPYIDIRQLLPVFNFSFWDLVKGAFGVSYIYLPIMLLLVMTPFTRDLRSARRFTSGALALGVLGFISESLSAIGIFGATGLMRYTWPTLEFVHIVNVRYLALEQLGVLLLTVWLVLTFGAAAFSYWGASYSLSQLFPKISYKTAMLILGLPTGLILLLPRNIIDTRYYLQFLQKWGTMGIYIFPLTIWLIAVIRGCGKGKKRHTKD